MPDEVIEEAEKHFSGDEITRLVHAIGAINVWSRLNVVGQPPVGSDRPGPFAKAAS